MSAPALIPVAVVDDHALMRGALADMIDLLGPYRVVLQAGNGLEFKEAVLGGTHVAVAVVDLHMPIMDGFATMEWMRTHAPGTRTLAITFEVSEEARLRALRSGACGFVRKNARREEFTRALQQISSVGYYNNEQPPELLSDVHGEGETERQRVFRLLTEREAEMIRLVCDDGELTYDQVAERMGVSPRTVDGYREAIFTKFHVKSKTGLVLFALRWGLIAHNNGA